MIVPTLPVRIAMTISLSNQPSEIPWDREIPHDHSVIAPPPRGCRRECVPPAQLVIETFCLAS
jgi:hypothetical protein